MPVFEFPVRGVIRIYAETKSDANDIVERGLKNSIRYRRAHFEVQYGDPIAVEELEVDNFVVPMTIDEIEEMIKS